jgi:S1-C subfamily serine protease
MLFAWEGCLPTAAADEAATAAQKISEASGDAVVSLEVVLNLRMVFEGEEADEEERTNKTDATVIDPSGLAVCSLSEIDPYYRIDNTDPTYRFESEIRDLKLIAADGTEIPGKVVLRDRDLDLAFVRPSEIPQRPLAAIDLSKNAEPQVMDSIVTLGRLGEIGNRVPWVTLDRIHALIEKPRTFYVCGMNTWLAGLGCPAFDMSGNIVGITLLRTMPGGADGSGDSIPVLLPAKDILEIAKQAPE